MRLFAATKFCCSDKDFHKNSPVHSKRFVATTCRTCLIKPGLWITANVINDEGIRMGPERSAKFLINCCCWGIFFIFFFSEKIIVTFEGPLVLELSTFMIGLHEAYDFHHTFCYPTLFTLFSCLSLPRRFFAAYIYKTTTERNKFCVHGFLRTK